LEILIGKANHIGHAMSTLSTDNMLNLIKVTLGIQLTYYAAVSSIKVSILCMYLRFCKSDLVMPIEHSFPYLCPTTRRLLANTW